jgi:hypothetical protein
VWFVQRCYKQGTRLELSQFCMGVCEEGLSAWSVRISTARSRCQGTAGEDTAGWKKLSGCCGNLWIVKIIGGTVIACSPESYIYKWSINPFTNPNTIYSHALNRDNIFHITLIQCPVNPLLSAMYGEWGLPFTWQLVAWDELLQNPNTKAKKNMFSL